MKLMDNTTDLILCIVWKVNLIVTVMNCLIKVTGRVFFQGAQSLDLLGSGINGDTNNDIWTRAANSALTPTAGEFVPSSTYESTNYHNNLDFRQRYYSKNKNPGSGRTGNYNTKNYDNLRGNRYRNENISSSSHERPYNNSRWNNNGSEKGNTKRNSKKHQMLEEMKAEGRKRLLEETSGLFSQKAKHDTTNMKDSGAALPNNSWRKHRTNHSYNGSANGMEPSNFNSSSDKMGGEYSLSQTQSTPNVKSHVSNNSSKRNEHGHHTSPHKNDKYSNKVTQRDRLTEQLNKGTLECLVCFGQVRQFDNVWSCGICYHVLHLRCIITWAKTSRADSGWRCPACQNVTLSTPQDYYCFCGRRKDPEWVRSETAHSCGEVCNRKKVNPSEYYKCDHHCTLLCHPGPCAPCLAVVFRNCGCGKTKKALQCGQTQLLACESKCGKELNCGEHFCEQSCHFGECSPCEIKITQRCFCGKENREVICDGEKSKDKFYSCKETCNLKLSCGHHSCSKECHEGDCGICLLDPSIITHCYCGKVELTDDQKRESCLDPIPTCSLICGKTLNCGQPSSPHNCKSLCHEGPCPPCEDSTLVRCRCGHMLREIPCVQLTTKADDARCQKKCTKKRMCGKHKCNQFCCIDLDHVCPLPCNHMLTCGQHRCEQLCHRGHCQPCMLASFEELYCECRRSVMFPPIPCGTRPPSCEHPCSRQHSCDHPVLHYCHSAPQCPPCTVLTAKYCHGKHELRKTVLCHVEEFSCGLPCGKPLNCGRHKCISPCHGGDCLKPGQLCKQPCTTPRELCGHGCNNPCHEGPCIDSPCKETVVVTCQCGNLSISRPCYENNGEYHRIATALLASKMADVQLGRTVHVTDMQGARKMSLKTLDCTDDCRLLERNRRLAIGLQIKNPDLSSKLSPRYSEFMRNWAKKDERFCQNVHDKLTELVKLAKQSKQKSRSYSFETMNRDKRQFVHEYCEHFGCESMAYDAEPKRNVVATAQRDKAWLPSHSLLEVLRREMGHRKPVTLNNTDKKSIPQQRPQPVRMSVNQTLASITAGTSNSQSTTSQNGNWPIVKKTPEPIVDYWN
uniref:Protein shuttle craft n=1 Tax=Clastoptera arizonana TaxID=38151 RepID=A0A1B6D4K5_9HEMI